MTISELYEKVYDMYREACEEKSNHEFVINRCIQANKAGILTSVEMAEYILREDKLRDFATVKANTLLSVASLLEMAKREENK